MHRDMGDQETALTYFQDALRLDIDSGQPKNMADSHTKVANVLKELIGPSANHTGTVPGI